MIVVMKHDATEKQIERVIDLLSSRDFDVHRSTGVEKTILGVVGTGLCSVEDDVRKMDGVEEVVRITKD
jgi:hypothetical protein